MNKEIDMNNVDITGYIKSVREAGTSNYKVLLASISQRDAFGKCVYTGQIVALDDEVKAQLLSVPMRDGVSDIIRIKGSLKTYFDRRNPDKLESRQQIVAHSITVG
jgi:hypothetical protein